LGRIVIVFAFLVSISLCISEGYAQSKEAKPIVIGASISQTGGFARSARSELNSFILASEQINQSGGVLGRPIKLIIYDDQSKESVAVSLYRKLIYEDKVDFLLSPFGSGPTSAVTPIIEQAKIPCVAPLASDPRIWEPKREWNVQILANSKEYFREGIDLAVNEQGVNTLAFVYLDSAMQVSIVNETKKYLAEKYPNVKVVLDARFPVGLEDYTSLLTKANATKADALFGGGYLPQSMEVVKAAKSVGYHPKTIEVLFGPDPLFGEGLGKNADGVMSTSGWEVGVQTPGSDEFVKAYRQRWNEEPYYDMAASYAAFSLLVEAIRKAGSIDRKAVRDYLFNVKTNTVYGEYAVNENGAQIAKKMLTIQWQNGKKEILMPKSLRKAAPMPLWGGK
jgi:branched-chain amino acid transport system substrate-binding protein